MRACATLLALAAVLPPPAAALRAYGHAYSRPDDFSDDQIAAIASRFEVFTVEKSTDTNKYGPHSSIAATVGTAKRIKALNNSVQVLMYWNAALHYGTYECESEVQPSWVFHKAGHAQPYYNYSVFAFREWWTQCAVDAFWGSGGYINGVFLDATPKVASGQTGGPGPADLKLWGEMVDAMKARLGPGAIVIDNGFFLGGVGSHATKLAGVDAWKHTGAAYAESMSSIGSGAKDPEQDIEHLRWLANASAANPQLELIGHGNIRANSSSAGGALDPEFEFGLAKYMLVAASMKSGWFLANSGYSIDGGLLSQPFSSVYSGDSPLGCGEPTAAFVREGSSRSTLLTRSFANGKVALDVKEGTATIKCGNRKP
jgi:hypothetical protein